MFDKAQSATDVRKERRQRRESLAAGQAEESEWLQSLWSGHLAELVTTDTSSRDVTTDVHEEPATVVDQPAGQFVATTISYMFVNCNPCQRGRAGGSST